MANTNDQRHASAMNDPKKPADAGRKESEHRGPAQHQQGHDQDKRQQGSGTQQGSGGHQQDPTHKTGQG
ncbi:hypothetical protein OSH11_17980 [Kaistia dalseonensis]|uniref:Uncharacterized protein n=1 Tax=Kaistia dalseonensis TaxID=410840 RepID=A0ABU0HA77_9HYPH|nr:hypothetical protein [Kaistia dalseonensis]MCX5496599.1 hypothetical protein [Kaistia dalseonensis]MDQ0439222.1 hypothetical protein [Kaistia dalseonensis]